MSVEADINQETEGKGKTIFLDRARLVLRAVTTVFPGGV